MQEQPLVSAVITTHNRLNLLKRAIDSVMTQTYGNIECIVVSDNSTDGTNEYCETCKDIRFISIPEEESRGGNYARNLGIKASNGEYVAFLDDDDEWLPEKIEKQVTLIVEKNCECVYCLRTLVKIKDGTIIHEYTESMSSKPQGDLSRIIFHRHITSTSALMVSREFLLRIGLFDEKLPKWQEFELMIRISQVSDIYCVPYEPLVRFFVNINDNNRISHNYSRFLPAEKLIKEKHKNLINSLPLKDWLLFQDLLYRTKGSFKRSGNNVKYGYFYLVYFYIRLVFSKFSCFL